MRHKSKQSILFVYLSREDLLRSHDLFILYKWTSELCVLAVSITRYTKWPSIRESWEHLSQWPRRYLTSVPKYQHLPNKPVVGTALQLFTSILVRSTVAIVFVRHTSPETCYVGILIQNPYNLPNQIITIIMFIPCVVDDLQILTLPTNSQLNYYVFYC
jgi:hypothetical protein